MLLLCRELAGKSRLWLCMDCPCVCSVTCLTHRIERSLQVISEPGHMNYYYYYCVAKFQTVHPYSD